MAVGILRAMEVVLFVLLGVLLVGAIAYIGWLQAEKRRKALSELATRRGWSFDAGADYGHDERFAHFDTFSQGHSRKAFNTLRGSFEEGRALVAGDYHYKRTSGSGKNRRTSTYTFSYLIVDLPWRRVPGFVIRPEGFFDKVKGAFGFDDIDFESAEFSRKFCVQSEDKRFAYDLCHAQMMEFLLKERPLAMESQRGQLMLCDGRSRWAPEELEERLDRMRRFLDLWPRHLVESSN